MRRTPRIRGAFFFARTWQVRTVGPHDFGAREKSSTHGVDLPPHPPSVGANLGWHALHRAKTA
ncbi:protein of unknown function [Stenotrophomonas maltophilia]|nr:protein of unknown function [Stenotrophomonas maltophilia]